MSAYTPARAERLMKDTPCSSRPRMGAVEALSVADTDISGWTLTDTNTPNIKYWPYAAMDYYIQLDVAPSVSALTETVILSDSGNSARRVLRLVRTYSRFPRQRRDSFELWVFSIPRTRRRRTSTTGICAPTRLSVPLRRLWRLTGH